MARVRPSGWTWAWMAWLIAFLCIELPAAASERGTNAAKTLSRHIWAWLDEWWEVVALVGFLVSLLLHLVPAIKLSVMYLVVFGVGLGVAIVRSTFFENGPASPAEGKEASVGWLKGVGGWLKRAGAATWTFVKKRGPIATNVIGAAAIVWPQLGVLSAAATALLGRGGMPSGGELTEALGALGISALATWRAGVKALSVYRKWRVGLVAPA